MSRRIEYSFLVWTPSSPFLHNYVILRVSKPFEVLRNIATRYALEKVSMDSQRDHQPDHLTKNPQPKKKLPNNFFLEKEPKNHEKLGAIFEKLKKY